MPKKILSLLAVLSLTPIFAEDSWKRAEAGWNYEFPRDEFAHPDFKTEWWYFTGNLESEDGKRFGYQLTFFRQGLRPPDNREPVESRFVTDHIWFGHFAISELDRDRFHFGEQFSRESFDLAGSGDGDRVVWIKNWTLKRTGGESPGNYEMNAAVEDFSISFRLRPDKPPVFHGRDGFSPKSANEASASHYYSLTRLTTEGSLKIGDREFEVSGLSWYDREWSTSALTRDQAGWDWFAIQLENDFELMLFQLRDPDGNTNFASGTLIRPDGSSQAIAADEIRLKPTKTWTAPDSKVSYPIEWDVEIASLDVALKVAAALENQQLRMAAMTYWEGATTIRGSLGGKPVRGRGYLELTGYDGKMTPLSQ